MKKIYLLTTLLVMSVLFSTSLQAQLPSKVLVGYWHNWNSLRLKDVDDRYNVICLSFLEADKDYPAQPDNNVVGDLEFTPYSSAQLKADIPVVQAQGKKVIISIGGANGSFKLNNTTDKNTFVSKVKAFIQEYGVDGIDIDIERTTYICPSGSQSMTNPAAHIQYLIDGCKELLSWYQTTYNKKMILTTAPEVTYTTGALSPWNACNGALLPFIEQLRDDIDLLMIQLYNSGSVYALPGWSNSNGTTYSQGTADFLIVSTEATIEGFTPKNTSLTGKYSGLPASKVVVALPACSSAGSGYVNTTNLKNALKYILGTGSKPGSYTLSSSYPELRGLMTWSINNDANSGCGGTYSFAQAFEDVFGTIDNNTGNSIEEVRKSIKVFPNPTNGIVFIETEELIGKTLLISNLNGQVLESIKITSKTTEINLSQYSKGFYTIKSENYTGKIILK